MDAAHGITLGILAGGRATRLGGVDKAWLTRNGVAQVVRWQRRFAREVDATLVSANGDPARYAAAGLEVVPDRVPLDRGPIAGIDALLARCGTPWLLTVPVDLVGCNECLLPSLRAAAGEVGAHAQDDDGVQPLVALWPAAAAPAVGAAIAAGESSIQRLQQALSMQCIPFHGVRFGNLNTPADLRAAGMEMP